MRSHLEHYGELLAAARQGGYRFAFFDTDPQPGDLLLRHDVDLSLEAALALAELEAELGTPATYLLMTRSEFYNLAAPSGEAAIERLRRLTHRVGLQRRTWTPNTTRGSIRCSHGTTPTRTT